ncbi:MAG: hypothetical protein HOV68_29585 [Streptomycetaceae bacterium]|nr:hypothetical protein [Streptomycetaceae bacterium]
MRRVRGRGHGLRAAGAAVPLATVILLGSVACGDDNPRDARDAATAVRSQVEEAGKKFDDIKDGADATKDVAAGPVHIDGSGRAVAVVTVTNTGDRGADFLIQVEFRNSSGDLVDTVLLTVDDVAPGGQAPGTARSNVDLSGDLTAKVPRALRH